MAFSRACVPAMIGRRWWDIFDCPPVLLDQHFGTLLSDRDLHPPTYYNGYLLRPRTQAAEQASGKSEFINERDKFQVTLNVTQFKPEEIEVKVVDNYIVIRGKHEERSDPDEYGSIQREFTRLYMLPEGADTETVKSWMSENGVLTVEAPKKAIETLSVNERVVPVSVSSPESNAKDKQM